MFLEYSPCLLWLCLQGVMLAHGASIGFFQGDIRLLMDDLAALKPTVFPVVPRLLNRMYDRVSQSTTPHEQQPCPHPLPLNCQQFGSDG